MQMTLKRMMAAALAATAIALAFVPAAWAAEPVMVDLPVTVEVEGAAPEEPETYVIQMTAADESFPMPAGAEGALAELEITGAATASFPTITYPAMGVFEYQVVQVPGTDELGTYDERAYRVVVSVTNGEAEGEMVATVAIHEEGAEVKPESIVFVNSYEAPLAKTGDMMMVAVIALAAIALLSVAAAVVSRSKLRQASHRK